MTLFKRIAKHLGLESVKALFSLLTALVLCFAVDGVNDWGDAPGGGFLIIFALVWALLSAFLVTVVCTAQSAGRMRRTSFTGCLLLLLASNCAGVNLICLGTIANRAGWFFFTLVTLTAVLSLWCFFRSTSTAWRASTAIGMPIFILSGVLVYVNIAGGETILQSSSPDRTMLAEVNRTTSGECVLLSGELTPFRSCLVQIRWGDIALRWKDQHNLQVTCKDCGRGDRVIEPGELTCSWHSVAVNYEFIGQSPLMHTTCPAPPQK